MRRTDGALLLLLDGSISSCLYLSSGCFTIVSWCVLNSLLRSSKCQPRRGWSWLAGKPEIYFFYARRPRANPQMCTESLCSLHVSIQPCLLHPLVFPAKDLLGPSSVHLLSPALSQKQARCPPSWPRPSRETQDSEDVPHHLVSNLIKPIRVPATESNSVLTNFKSQPLWCLTDHDYSTHMIIGAPRHTKKQFVTTIWLRPRRLAFIKG